MIYLVGDTHATLDISKLSELQKIATEKDIIIVLGDFGLPGFSKDKDRFLMEHYARFKCKILFIDGNHEHFDKLSNYAVTQWNGGNVQFITKNVIHLMRGEIYIIDGIKFLTCGGALSIDKYARTEHINWFKEEELNYQEFNHMIENLSKHNNKVDFILTHTPPQNVVNMMFPPYKVIRDNTAIALDELEDRVEYKKWISGHLHMDKVLFDNKHIILYNNIMTIEDLEKI